MFFHIRNLDDDGKILPNGGFTACAMEKWGAGNILVWGIAKCHEGDTYCKRTGRIKSEGRARSNAYSFHTEKMEPALAMYFANTVCAVLESTHTSAIPKHEIASIVMVVKEKYENSSSSVQEQSETEGNPS